MDMHSLKAPKHLVKFKIGMDKTTESSSFPLLADIQEQSLHVRIAMRPRWFGVSVSRGGEGARVS